MPPAAGSSKGPSTTGSPNSGGAISNNRSRRTTSPSPLPTTLRPSPTHVELPAGEGGLDHPSMAKCEQITTLDKSFLLRGPFAGTISPAKMQEIEKAIQWAIGILAP